MKYRLNLLSYAYRAQNLSSRAHDIIYQWISCSTLIPGIFHAFIIVTYIIILFILVDFSKTLCILIVFCGLPID